MNVTNNLPSGYVFYPDDIIKNIKNVLVSGNKKIFNDSYEYAVSPVNGKKLPRELQTLIDRNNFSTSPCYMGITFGKVISSQTLFYIQYYEDIYYNENTKRFKCNEWQTSSILENDQRIFLRDFMNRVESSVFSNNQSTDRQEALSNKHYIQQGKNSQQIEPPPSFALGQYWYGDYDIPAGNQHGIVVMILEQEGSDLKCKFFFINETANLVGKGTLTGKIVKNKINLKGTIYDKKQNYSSLLAEGETDSKTMKFKFYQRFSSGTIIEGSAKLNLKEEPPPEKYISDEDEKINI